MSPHDTDLSARIDRLESLDAIRQLASKYAFAIDVRDLDAVVALYVDDAKVGPGMRGRAALRQVFDQVLRRFGTTSHQVQNHVVDFSDTDHAKGLVSCRCEHEVETPDGLSHWVVVQNVYHDRYERRDGHWYFGARVQHRIYATAAGDPPVGPNKLRWPGEAAARATFHDAFPSWHAFWCGPAEAPEPPPWGPDSVFVTRLRRSERLPPLAGHIAAARQRASRA